MLGSSQSISGPNVALNTIMAEQLRQFADRLEGAEHFDKALHELVREVFTNHQRIIFSGNGYSDEWKCEAARRGLDCETSTPILFDHFLDYFFLVVHDGNLKVLAVL